MYLKYKTWDDLRFPFTRDKQGQTSLPDFDFTNLGLLMPQNDATEIVYLIAQFPHNKAENSVLRPHIHFIQSESNIPTFKMEYRWYNNGELVPSGWTTLSTDDGEAAFTYTSGDMLQIISFPTISENGESVSSIMDIKIYRDDNLVTGDVLTKEFDIHYIIDTMGSKTEFQK